MAPVVGGFACLVRARGALVRRMARIETIALGLALLSTGCTLLQRQQAEQLAAQVLISDEQEASLGLQVHEELLKKNTRFSSDPTVVGYVQGLARKLEAPASRDRTLGWQWFVIDDPGTINAFATPGGRVYVYTGLLLAAQTEAEVVGVLGHEMGHVVGRHSARQLVAAKGLETVAAMALGKDAPQVALVASQLVGSGAVLAYGRDMELEADRYGARYSSTTGYDPRGLTSFFEKLKAKYGDTGPVLTLLSTHPSNSDRINRLTALIAEEGLSGAQGAPGALRAVQDAIRRGGGSSAAPSSPSAPSSPAPTPTPRPAPAPAPAPAPGPRR